MAQELIIFTDLDGTLLDHADYAWADAAAALALIRRCSIPLIFVTSKTRVEVELLQRELGLHEPFIVENGGAIFFPAGYRGWSLDADRSVAGYRVIELGMAYGAIRDFIARFGARFGIRGFGDWSISEIADRTGLSAARSALAAQREYTEPFLPAAGADMDGLQALAATHGLKITRGGRFYHLIGSGQDKGRAVRAVREIAARNLGANPLAVGVGDSENDLPMLAAVDIPVLIPRPDGSRLELRLPRLVVAEWPGSRGWNAAITRIVDGCTATAA